MHVMHVRSPQDKNSKGISCRKPRNRILRKCTPTFIRSSYLHDKLVAGHRNAFSAPLGLSLVTLPSPKTLSFLWCNHPDLLPTQHQRFPQPSTLNRTIPWVRLGACWLSGVQWTAQIAWGVENSFVTGTLLSAKARWSFTVAALSMWNCFFSQENPRICPHLPGP